MVSASGLAWDLSELGLDPDPDLSALVQPGDSLRYTCAPSLDDVTNACDLPEALLGFETTRKEQRCRLASLSALPPDQPAGGAYAAALELVSLPEPEVCHPGVVRPAAATAETLALSVDAMEEGFRYTVQQPLLTLAVDAGVADVLAKGHRTFGVRRDTQADQAEVISYSGALAVTPANAGLPPFTLVQGQRVMITRDKVMPLPALDQIFVPAISAR